MADATEVGQSALDPWQAQTLTQLATYLDSAAPGSGGAWAVVATTSANLRAQVVAALGQQLPTTRMTWVRPEAEAKDPSLALQRAVSRVLDLPIDPQIRIIDGLDAALHHGEPRHLLSWLNFQREAFERPGEAFVFALDCANLATFTTVAPDLNRYTLHFEFSAWDDLCARAEAAAQALPIPIARDEAGLADSRAWMAEAEKLGDSAGANLARAAVAHFAYLLGRWEDVDQAIGLESCSPTKDEPYALFRIRAIRLVLRGQPELALEHLHSVNAIHRPNGRNDLAVAHAIAGDTRKALDLLEGPALASGTENSLDLANRAGWLRQLGELREVSARLSRVTSGTLSSNYDCLQALDAVERGKLVPAINAAWAAKHRARDRADALLNAHWALAEVAFVAGQCRFAREHLRQLTALPHARLSHCWEPQWLQARIAFALDGPSALQPLIAEEQRRQQGWATPKPRALLSYMHALASTKPTQIHGYLMEASSQLRAMDQWLYLSEVERQLARLERLAGDFDGAEARVREGLAWHQREGAVWREALDRAELAAIALAQGAVDSARDDAARSLELIRSHNLYVYEPTALVTLAAVERARGRLDTARAYTSRAHTLLRYLGTEGFAEQLAPLSS